MNQPFFFFSVVFRYCPWGIERAKSEPSESDEAWKPTVHSQNICLTVCVNQEFVLTGTELDGQTNYRPWVMEQIFHLKVVAAPSDQAFYVLQSAFMRRDRRQGQAGYLLLLLKSPPGGLRRTRLQGKLDFRLTSGPLHTLFTCKRSLHVVHI